MLPTGTTLKTLFIGVAPRSRGALLLKIALKFCPEFFCPVAFVDATADLARTEAIEGGWSEMPCYGDLGQALAEAPADAAVITSPAKFHGAQIRACLEAGLHVFVAKPMTYDLDEAASLVKLAADRGLCLLVDQQIRFQRTISTVAEWVRAHKYGEPGFVEFSMHRHRPLMRSFTGSDPYIWEQGVHTFNTLIAILDRPALRVLAHQSAPPWTTYNGPTTVMGAIEFEGKIPCSIFGTFESLTDSQMVRLDFRDAAVRLANAPDTPQWIEVAPPGKPFQATGIDDRYGPDDPPREVENFRNFHIGCTGGGRVPNDGWDNLRTLAVVDAFIRSSRSGKQEDVRQFDPE